MEDFRLNKVCTTSKGSRYVGTYKHINKQSVWEDCIENYVEWEDIEYEGIRLMPEGYSNKDVVVSENRLFLDGYEVSDYPTWVERFGSLSNEIPRYYVIRKYEEDRKYSSFEGGFDLLNDGRAWEGLTRTEYDSVSDALKFIREKLGDDFYIALEEPMRL
jgi:hypothetical protein